MTEQNTEGPTIDISISKQWSCPTVKPGSTNTSFTENEFSKANPKQAKIMIVDDEQINIKVVQRYLNMSGYENFISTSDSTKAMEIAKQENPDILLLDIKMPKVDGFEILELIRADEILKYTPVVILTASADAATRQRALELGATDFLAKPVDPSDLVLRVRNTLIIKAHHDQTEAYVKTLEHEVHKRTDALAKSRLDVIHCLARAAEYRDNDTGHHIDRVGRYVGLIARKLGLDNEQVEMMEHASPLHDVGKIGIPDKILLKPGKLTEDEYEIMHKHCQMGGKVFHRLSKEEHADYLNHAELGVKILGDTGSALVEMASRIALTHHEKWDGTGYPLALSGEDIPIEGRITAVADVFDALSSIRPYKPAFSKKKCFAIMSEERGKHFDPRVLDAFFSLKDEITKIQIELADLG